MSLEIHRPFEILAETTDRESLAHVQSITLGGFDEPNGTDSGYSTSGFPHWLLYKAAESLTYLRLIDLPLEWEGPRARDTVPDMPNLKHLRLESSRIKRPHICLVSYRIEQQTYMNLHEAGFTGAKDSRTRTAMAK